MTLRMNWNGLHKVISGGQTGADQGGLMAAFDAGVKTGGTAPAVYKTSNGYNPILEVFGLDAVGDFNYRTRKNIQDSDATVIVAYNLNSPGTVLTRQLCAAENKPFIQIDINDLVELSVGSPTEPNVTTAVDLVVQKAAVVLQFIKDHQVQVLNVAGNRERTVTNGLGKLVVFSSTRWIIGTALEILDLDRQLVKI